MLRIMIFDIYQDIRGNESSETIEPPPTLTPERQAEEIVLDYYDNISEQQYDAAYVLLNSVLQSDHNFQRPAWDNYVSTNTFVIQNDIVITKNGNVYKAEFELTITPSKGTETSGTWTFCVTHNPQEEIWMIRNIYDKSKGCW